MARAPRAARTLQLMRRYNTGGRLFFSNGSGKRAENNRQVGTQAEGNNTSVGLNLGSREANFLFLLLKWTKEGTDNREFEHRRKPSIGQSCQLVPFQMRLSSSNPLVQRIWNKNNGKSNKNNRRPSYICLGVHEDQWDFHDVELCARHPTQQRMFIRHDQNIRIIT